MKSYGVFEGIKIIVVLCKHKGQCRNRGRGYGGWKMAAISDEVVKIDGQ